MIRRIYKLFKLIWEYIYKGTISLDSKKATLYLDEEGNLFILPNNLVLQSKGYNFIDCDPRFTALAISYSKRGESIKLKSLIENEVSSLLEETSAADKAKISVSERGKINVSS